MCDKPKKKIKKTCGSNRKKLFKINRKELKWVKFVKERRLGVVSLCSNVLYLERKT